MQIILGPELQCIVSPIPSNPALAEGGIMLLFTDVATGIQVPVSLPRLSAVQVASQMLACTKQGEQNGGIFPEPVYGVEELTE